LIASIAVVKSTEWPCKQAVWPSAIPEFAAPRRRWLASILRRPHPFGDSAGMQSQRPGDLGDLQALVFTVRPDLAEGLIVDHGRSGRLSASHSRSARSWPLRFSVLAEAGGESRANT